MSEKQPNIVLFTTDQHRGDHLGVAGHPALETPCFDAMTANGAYFPNAYSEIPSTTGARLCLNGGQGSYDCGQRGYSATEWHPKHTLAQCLADAGYHCINVGWRNMHPRRKLYGYHTVIPHDLREGCDDYWDFLKEKLGPEAWEFDHIVHMNGWNARPWPYPDHWHSTVWTTNVAIEQIRKRDPTRPFFIWISHLRPHSPYDPPQSFFDMYINRELPPIPVGDWAKKYDMPITPQGINAHFGKLSDEQNQRMRAAYMGSITHLDYEYGRLCERIHRVTRELGNTFIIMTSDHGDMMGDHYHHRKSYGYEGSARIPFLMRYPSQGDYPTGTFPNVVGLQDVMPTILDVAGVDIPDTVTGRSLLKAARGEEWREFLHGEHSPDASPETGMHYLTDGKEKYIWFPATGDELFFDLEKDRSELHNLAQDPARAERVALWRQRLIDKLGKRGDGFSDGKKLLLRPEGWSSTVEE